MIAMLILSGCASAGSDSVYSRLDPLVIVHAAALAGDDVAKMRSTGRDLIATFDAARGAQ